VGITTELAGSTEKVSSHRHFAVLDGLRGLAAYCVIAYHSPLVSWCRNGWLAVDFFFVLSGFVIAHSYGERIGSSLPISKFIKLRLIRLYPMIFIGTLIGVCYNAALLIAGLHEPVSMENFSIMSIMAFVVIPDLTSSAMGGLIYPMNRPAWSLFFELAANLLYALFSRWLTWPPLVGAAVAGGAVTVWGGLNVGSEANDFWFGFGRVICGFSIGLLLHRVWNSGRVSVPDLGLVPLGFICFVAFAMPLKVTPFIYIACLAVFSLVVLSGARFNTIGRELKWCAILGSLSYPVYLLHGPILSALDGASKKLHGSSTTSGMAVLILSIAATTIAAMLCLKYFDIPVREWLKVRGLSSKRRPAI
jgi:peptidoglycan/LPS O-acetylase OafA/YrhL